LEAVTLGLGRAATGNIGALTRLGIPLDENTKKSKDFGAALLTLEQQFGGAAAVAADTFSGRVKILRTSLGEVVEEIGFALLPTAERLVEFLQKRLLPALQAAADGFREEGLSGALKYFLAALGPFGVKVIDTIEAISLSVITLGGHLDVVAAIIAAGAFVAQPSKALDIFNGILDRSNNAASNASAKFDALRLSILNTGNALNFANNQISPLIDQTDRIGQKVLPKAKESTDDFNAALTKVGGGGGSAPKVKKAVEDVAKSVEATVNVFDELSKALKTVTSQQKSFDSAQKSSLNAKKQLVKSDLSLADAQQQFNQAVQGFGADSVQAKDAQKKLSIANRAVAQAGFRVEDSIFAVQDAEKKLAETRADPDSNPRMIREAEIALEEAKLRVVEAIEAEDEATLARTESQVKLNEVINGAIVGSVVYDSLLKDLNEAKDAQTEASERAAEAIQNETDAFNDLAEAIRNAAIAQGNIPVAVAPVFRPEEIDKGFSLPTLPTVPAPAGAISGTTQVPSGGATIVVNTGVGTNGIEAGRQIVQLLQQYTAVDAFAIDKLGFAPRR
jgi:nitrate reductase NapAB chaperone NapD